MISPAIQGMAPPITTVVVVVIVPMGVEYPPPLVSFTAMHAGAFTPDNANVRVHVLLLLGAVPNSTLPAKSEPTMLAPAPQSGPSVGVTAKDAVDHSNRAATVVIALTAKVFRRMISAPDSDFQFVALSRPTGGRVASPPVRVTASSHGYHSSLAPAPTDRPHN